MPTKKGHNPNRLEMPTRRALVPAAQATPQATAQTNEPPRSQSAIKRAEPQEMAPATERESIKPSDLPVAASVKIVEAVSFAKNTDLATDIVEAALIRDSQRRQQLFQDYGVQTSPESIQNPDVQAFMEFQEEGSPFDAKAFLDHLLGPIGGNSIDPELEIDPEDWETEEAIDPSLETTDLVDSSNTPIEVGAIDLEAFETSTLTG